MIIRYLRVSLFVLLAGTSAPAHAAGSCDGGNRVETFPLSAVRLTDGPFKRAQELDKRLAALAGDEQERARLETVTVDVVACGEQQPESDHFIEMQNTASGADNDRHWRVANAGGWFAYSMIVGEKQPAALSIKMKAEAGESAIVTADGDRIGTLKAGDGDGLTDIIVMLPEGFKAGKTVNVKVEADGQQPTPRIYEVRLVTAEALGDSRP